MKKISICILFSTRFSIISYGFQYLSLFESSIHTSRGVPTIISLGMSEIFVLLKWISPATNSSIV